MRPPAPYFISRAATTANIIAVMVNVCWNTRTPQRQPENVRAYSWVLLHSFIPFGLLPMKFKLNYISKLMDPTERYTHCKHEIWVIQSTGMHWLQNRNEREKRTQETANEEENIKRHRSTSSATEFNTVRQYRVLSANFQIRWGFVSSVRL